jgi:hypothetical protein
MPRLEYDPREIGEREDLPPIEWVPSLGCWCVFAAEEIAFVLKSHDFVVADFTDLHQKLAQKVGIDCSAAVEALGHIAIAHKGERHARIRKDTARILKADLALTKQNTAAAASEIVSKTCQPGSSVDLVRDIVRPGLRRHVCKHPWSGIRCKAGCRGVRVPDLRSLSRAEPKSEDQR